MKKLLPVVAMLLLLASCEKKATCVQCTATMLDSNPAKSTIYYACGTEKENSDKQSSFTSKGYKVSCE